MHRLRPRVLLAVGLAVSEPVEVADLVRAVVAAVPGTDAPVVDLHVEAVGRVVRGVHGAHRLARGVAAMLTHHRHEARVEVGRELVLRVLVAFVVALEANPGHFTALDDVRPRTLIPGGRTQRTPLIGRADGRDVVLAVAGGDAGRATGAPCEIDGHRPAALLHLLHVVGGVHPEVLGVRVGQLTLRVGRDRRLEASLEILRRQAGDGVLFVLAFLGFLSKQRGEGHGLTDATAVLTGGAFGGDQLRCVRRDGDLALGAGEGEGAGGVPTTREQVEGVDADVLCEATVGRVTEAERDGDGIGTHAHVAIRRRGDLAGRRFDGEVLSFDEAELLEGGGVDFDPRLPRDLGDGIGEFLQPRLVGTATITERGRRIDMHEVVTRPGIGRRGGGRQGARGGGDQRCTADGGLGERGGEGRGAARELADEPAAVIGGGVLRGQRLILLGERDEYVGGGLRVEHRFERGLLQADLALHSNRVAPAFEPVIVGENQIAQLCGFVGDRRERHLERHLGKGRGEAGRLGHGVGRVGPPHEGERHATGAHLGDDARQIGVRREAVVAGMANGRLDGDTDGSGLLVDLGHHDTTVDGIRGGDTADGHHTVTGSGDSLRQRFEGRDRHTRGLGGGGHRPGARERRADFHLAAGLGGDPLIGVETGEGAARADVDETRSAFQLGAGVGPVELLRHTVPPAVEEVGPEADDELGGVEVERRPRRAVRLLVRGDGRHGRPGVDAQMRRHTLRRQPLVEEAWEGARLVLIHEDDVGRLRAALDLADFLGEELVRLVPRGGLEGVALAHHRRAIAIGIVQPLHRREASGADRAAAHGVVGVAIELDGTAVADFRHHAAGCGALAAGGRVVLRHTGHGVIRGRDVRNELPHLFGGAAHYRGRRTRGA